MKAHEWKKHEPRCRRTMFRLCLCHCGSVASATAPLSLDFLIRESVPRQVDKNPGSLKGGQRGAGALEVEIGGLEFSKEKERTNIFFLYSP